MKLDMKDLLVGVSHYSEFNSLLGTKCLKARSPVSLSHLQFKHLVNHDLTAQNNWSYAEETTGAA